MATDPFAVALASLDAREERLTGFKLGGHQSWHERAHEVHLRLTHAVHGDGLPDVEMLDMAGAHLLALRRAAAAAHAERVEGAA
jgi:hypothetical protein